MNIILLSYDGYQGPGVIHMHHFANELAAQGHTVLFLLHGDVSGVTSMSESPAYQLAQLEYSGAQLTQALLQRATHFRPDIVHAWTPRNVPVHAGLTIALATGARLIIHYEDDEEAIYAQFVGDLFADPQRYAVSVTQPLSYAYFHPTISPAACRFASGFTVISPMIIPRVEQYWGKQAHLLYPGVDLQRFSAELQPEAELLDSLNLRGKTVLVYCGAIGQKFHDFDILLEALALLVGDFPTLTLAQVGRVFSAQGPDEAVARLGLQEYVRFVGMMPHKDIPRYLALGRALVQPGKPNVFNEGRLPSKLPEYMAMGKPIVTFSVGFGRMLSDGKDVLKTYTDDPAELAARLRQLLTDPTLCVALGAQARLRAQELFNWRENTADLLRFYAQVCSASDAVDVSQEKITSQRFARSAAALDEVHIRVAVIGSSARARQLVDCIVAAGRQRINFASVSAQLYAALPASFGWSERPTVIVFADGPPNVVATKVATTTDASSVAITPETTEVAIMIDAARYVARIAVWELPQQALPAGPQPAYDMVLPAEMPIPTLADALVQSAWQPKPLRAQQPADSSQPANLPFVLAQPRYRNALSYALAEIANNYEHGGVKSVLRYGMRFILGAGRRQ